VEHHVRPALRDRARELGWIAHVAEEQARRRAGRERRDHVMQSALVRVEQ